MNLKHFYYRQYFDFDNPRSRPYLPGSGEDGKPSAPDKDVETVETYYREQNAKLTGHLPEFARAKLHAGLGNVPPLQLVVQNPGLLPGVGYPHEVGGTGEFKLGFSFDHTSGLPVLPGSSVKGVLRSVFPQFEYDPEKPWILLHPEDEGKQGGKVQEHKAKFIVKLLGKQGIVIPDQKATDIAHALELAIFEGWNTERFSEQIAEHIPMCRHDVFFDALPISSGKLVTGESRLLGRDALTPHNSSLLKNPTPLPFVKVLPGVTFEFAFRLHNSSFFGQTLTAEQKRALFSAILCTVGAGAKTNVGYGQFADPAVKEESGHSADQQKMGTITGNKGTIVPARKKQLPFNRHLVGKTTLGEVSRVDGEKVWFRLPEVEGYNVEIEISVPSSLASRFQSGGKFELKIHEANPAKNILKAKVNNYIAK